MQVAAPFPLLDLPTEILENIASRWIDFPYGLPAHALCRSLLDALSGPADVARRAIRRYGGADGVLFPEIARASRCRLGTDVVAALLDAGADVACIRLAPLEPAGQTALRGGQAARRAEPTKPVKRTAAAWAAVCGAPPELLELLLDRGAPLNGGESEWRAPLVEACRRGDAAAVRVLLDRGADVHIDHGGALYGALDVGDAVSVALLLDRAPLSTFVPLNRGHVFHRAMGSEHHCANARLLSQRMASEGPGFRFAAQYFLPGLQAAISKKCHRCVRTALGWGADPNGKSTMVGPPIHGAVREGQPEVVEVLLKAGADPNAQAGYGSVPLHHAVQVYNADGHATRIVQALLDHGADPNLVPNGETVFARILRCQDGEGFAGYLLDRGADPDAAVIDRSGHTARDVMTSNELYGLKEEVAKALREWAAKQKKDG